MLTFALVAREDSLPPATLLHIAAWAFIGGVVLMLTAVKLGWPKFWRATGLLFIEPRPIRYIGPRFSIAYEEGSAVGINRHSPYGDVVERTPLKDACAAIDAWLEVLRTSLLAQLSFLGHDPGEQSGTGP